MSDDSTRQDPSAVAALIAVTETANEHDDPTAEMARLLRAIVDALGARAAVLQAADPREGRFSVVGSVNIPAGLEDVTMPPGVADQAHGKGMEVDLDGGSLPDALRVAGFNHALALPVRSSERSLGVVWVAGAEPLRDDHLRRHAARVGAERIGTLLEQVRLYETLERAMAQILEGDERMLGRIGLDIHDGPTQQLSVALLEVQLLEADLNDAEAEGVVLPETLRPGAGPHLRDARRRAPGDA